MTFKQWIFSSYSPNPHIDGQYGLLHILTLVFIALFITVSTLLLRNKSEKAKRIVLIIIASIILFFEVLRRIINLIKTEEFVLLNLVKTLVPRPGCAISCWLVMLAVLLNKKFMYNFASIIGVLCGVIFFIYPGAGYNNRYILFENVYSIVTHMLFTTASICFITYKFTDFRYKNIWKELICFAVLAVYVLLEIVFKVELDPFYFMPNNDVQDIVGLSYPLFITLYSIFIVIYLNLYYLIQDRKTIFKKK